MVAGRTTNLLASLPHLRAAPIDGGVVELVVARPTVGERVVLDQGTFDTEVGLIGDSWHLRPSRHSVDGGPHPEMQLNITSARASAAIAGAADEARALFGDQLHLDLDLSEANLPAGTRLAMGTAVIEITPRPHTGCEKFRKRFGLEAVRFVNSPAGRELSLRGRCARVVTSGVISRGDVVRRLPAE
jgi:MOSC domain-containing protein YiiM